MIYVRELFAWCLWLMGGGGGPHSPMYVVWLMGEEEEGLTHPCTWCGQEDDILTGAAGGLMLV